MTIIAYLMDYSFSVLCGGNKSELSRKLDYRRGDLNRMLERVKEGAHNIRATEAVLKFMHAEECKMDVILAGYGDVQSVVPGEAVNLACEDMAHALREQMANHRRTASQKMQILQSAETFMRQLERAFCSDLCRMRRGCDAGCPCKRFSNFVDWIQAEMDADAKSGAIEAGATADCTRLLMPPLEGSNA